MDVGELPVPGQLYQCRNHKLKLFKGLSEFVSSEDEERTTVFASEPCGLITQGDVFMFTKVVHEVRIPGEIKKVWFQVVYKELIGVVYNGQIPFHQFLLKVAE